MARCLFVIISLLVILVERGYSEKEILRSGKINDPEWWYMAIKTAGKGPEPAQGWYKGNILFESKDPENGAWAITDPVKLPKDVTYFYVGIAAKKTKCQFTCSLQIFTFDETAKEFHIPRAWDRTKQREYLLKNFKPRHNVTFTEFNKIEMQSFTFVSNGSKIRFGVRARGITGELHNMTLYYYYCDESVRNGVRLPRTIAPANGTQRLTLNCTSNAVSKDNESSVEGSCRYNGTWVFPGNDTGCFCRPGYEMLEMGCQRCRQNYYKSKKSNEDGCKLCPSGTINSTENTGCKCIKGRYRLKNESRVNKVSCYGFPSKVRDIRIKKGNSSGTIILRWKNPKDDGGMPSSLKYDVDCVPDSNRLKYTPRRTNLTKSSVQISGLISGYQYNFTVFSKNTISELYANGSYAFRRKIYKAPSDDITVASTRMIIIVTGVTAGFLLGVVLIVVLVKLKRRKRPSKSSTLVDIPLEPTKTSSQSQLPTDQEPGYEAVERIERDIAATTRTSGEANAGHKVSANDEEHYERVSKYESYEEPDISSQNLDYAELDRNRRRNSENDGEYQKLKKLDSDYVIPAHERPESACEYEDMKMGRNLPDYQELDQNKRETEESQSATYQSLN